MPFSPTALRAMRRIYEDGFQAKDIAEPLVSFDDVTDALLAGELASGHEFDVVGVRHLGIVAGYALASELNGGLCGDHLRDFDPPAVIEPDESLGTVLSLLGQREHVFVRSLGVVGGIVTASDVEKPPVRMWLFGMVTLIESRLTQRIAEALGDQWRQYLSPARLEKAESLQAERNRRQESPSLLECLQFSDKVQIVARHPQMRAETRFESRRQLEAAARDLQSLRNNLAHSQQLVTYNGETIVELANQLENILG